MSMISKMVYTTIPGNTPIDPCIVKLEVVLAEPDMFEPQCLHLAL